MPAALVVLGLAVAERDLWAQSDEYCAGQGELQSLSLTDWENGLGGWTADTYDVASPVNFDTADWAVVGDLPAGRSGQGAFVANIDTSDCDTDDESGVLTLTSPEIQIPAGTARARVSVNHWFHVEYGWDGGNLKVSVNGGAFALVPPSAFEAAPYSDRLFPRLDEFGVIYNTNPLADEEAFTGPDGDTASGWVESLIDLADLAGPGDKIRLRFDFGVDACQGAVGWYVDEVEFYGCSTAQPVNPLMTLSNSVTNDNGGSAEPPDWLLTATGPSEFSGLGPEVSGGSALEPGSYDLSASGPGDYQAANWVCSGTTQVDGDTVQLAAGEVATCTLTLDDVPPALTLIKRVMNDDGGMATPDDWTLSADGPSPFNGRGPQVFNGANFQAGTYNLSEGGGPAGYLASDWVCEGGEQQDRDTVVLDIGDSTTCTITNDDTGAGFVINQGLVGGWFDEATSGQGILLDIRPQDQFMFMAWFTYTDAASANPNEHRWLTAQGNYAGDTAVLTLYEVLDGRFDDPQEVSFTPIGEVSLRFSSCDLAEMNFVIEDEGLQGTVPLQRLIPGSGALCEQLTEAATQAVDINDGMDGGWYEPATAGQGFLLDTRLDAANGNFIFVAWFTYGDDTASGLRWLTAQGGFEGSFAEIEVSETTGGSFNDPLIPTTVPVGTMRIDFNDCNSAMLTYDLPDDGVEGEIELERLLPGSEALCEELSLPE